MVDEDPRFFYYDLDCHVRELPDMALTEIGQLMASGMPGCNWRAIGDRLGYTMTMMNNFEHMSRMPGYELLKDWAMKQGSTIRVLKSKLQELRRQDVDSLLDDKRKNPITLLVMIHDSEPPPNTYSNYQVAPEIKGRRDLWEGLLPFLKDHVTKITRHRRYTFFNLRGLSWKNECHQYQGQQVEIDVKHQDTTPTDSVPGFRITEVEPSWCLMSPTQLRYSRNEVTVQTETAPSNRTEVVPSGASFIPQAKDTTRTGKQNSPDVCGSGKSNSYRSEGHTHSIQESCDVNFVENLEKRNKHVSFICVKKTNAVVQSSEEKDLSTQETTGHSSGTVRNPLAHETMKLSLDLDLRSCEDPKPPHYEQTMKKLSDLNLRSEARLAESHETNISPKSETSAISLRSDDVLSENYCGMEVRNLQESYSSAMVAMTPSSSTPEPGKEPGQEPMELRESDLLMENENLMSEGFVSEESIDQKSVSLGRRHLYCRPKSEMIRSQFPGLWDVPGFHPKLKHKMSLISEVMKPYEKTDGWYLIGAFRSDEDMTKVQVAITVTHKGKLKHFMILQTLDSNPRRYFLFSRDFEARSISELIDHYKIHPLIPVSGVISGTNLPKLINPIPKDSFNYM